MTPETERRFVEVALKRKLVDEVRLRAAAARARAPRGARARTLPRLLCDEGLLESKLARALLNEVRVRARIPALAMPVREKTLPLAAPDSTVLVPGGTDPAEPAPAPDPTPGVLQAGAQVGPYKILSELGRGGMGVVYRARHLGLGREVALKTLSGLADKDAIERFLREGRAAGRVKHPNVVTVYEVAAYSGLRVIALELVEGVSLAHYVHSSGPLPPQYAAQVVRDVARGVAAVHAQGVLHRDLKPGNILLEKGEGRAPHRLRPRARRSVPRAYEHGRHPRDPPLHVP